MRLIEPSNAPPPQPSTEQTPENAKAVFSLTPAAPDESQRIPEDIRRRYEMPFETSWVHGGLNEKPRCQPTQLSVLLFIASLTRPPSRLLHRREKELDPNSEMGAGSESQSVVAQASLPAVSRVSNRRRGERFQTSRTEADLPTGKSAIRQVGKPCATGIRRPTSAFSFNC